MRRRVRQSLPIFLSGGSVRDGERNQRRNEAEDQLRELRALQDLRHRGPVSNYRLGGAGGRRRPELRGHVELRTPSPMFSQRVRNLLNQWGSKNRSNQRVRN